MSATREQSQFFHYDPSLILVTFAADPTLRIAEEAQEMIDLLTGVHLLLNERYCLRKVQSRTIENLVCLLDTAAHVKRNARTRDADTIQPDRTCGMPVHHCERNDILHELRRAADHRIASDLHELVHACHAADHDAILDNRVSRKHRCIAHDDAIAQDAVVRNMRVRHEETVVADARLFPLTCRTVYRRTLADRRAVANERIALLALELQILRHLTNGRPLEYMAVTTDLRPLLDHDVRADLRPLTDLDMVRDDRIGANLHVLCDACCRCNHRRLMDVGNNLAAACHLFQLLQPCLLSGQTFSTLY